MTYLQITAEESKAPQGKYRVILHFPDSDPYLRQHVRDYDSVEEAARAVDRFRVSRKRFALAIDPGGKVLYPEFDMGHQFFTRQQLRDTHGCELRSASGALTDAHIDAIESDQPNRLPGWKPGHRLIVFWSDIAEATGAEAQPGNF